ncbi:MAG: ATP-dependent zinc metalloprotease FtsH [Desulfobulbaceae bacterium]|nr:ATP-dependent zinc metalloprotease FtsH [Desulfobulbaceae bacterium]
MTLVAFLAGTGFFFWSLETRLPSLSYNDFVGCLHRNEISGVHLRGNKDVVITDTYGRKFAVFLPDTGTLLPQLLAKGIPVTSESESSPLLVNFLSVTLPLLIILIIGFYVHRKMAAADDSESDFAKKKAISPTGGGKRVTFRDVAGIPEVKEELLEVVDFLQRPKKYSRLGATVPKGILLAGPPGTGKTLLARAIAGEAGVPFFSISGSDFVEMFVGVGASRVRELFVEAKKSAPCIIFIDEIDAVGGTRAGGASVGGTEERAQTLNALLVEMDGFGGEDTILILAATNRPDILDPALLRPGRFDRQVNILPPDVKGRLKILEVHACRLPLAEGVELSNLAKSTPGFTGAQLANLVNEAALLAARAGKDTVDLRDFEAAKDRMLMGVQRKGMVISEFDRRTMAYHEAGHAILAKHLPQADPLHKISIIPSGRAMGHTQQIPLDDRHAYSKEYLRSRIIILMGGRAAEEIVLAQQTTGAEEDISLATQIARKMVCRWGMSDAVGPLAYVSVDDGFLGESSSPLSCSAETARMIDLEVKKLVESCYTDAVELVKREEASLRDLAEVLLQTETLDREEMDIIWNCSAKKQASVCAADFAGPARQDV